MLILKALIKTTDKYKKSVAFDFNPKIAKRIIKRIKQLDIDDIAEVELSGEEGKLTLFSLFFTAPLRLDKTHKLSDLIFMLIYESKLKP